MYNNKSYLRNENLKKCENSTVSKFSKSLRKHLKSYYGKNASRGQFGICFIKNMLCERFEGIVASKYKLYFIKPTILKFDTYMKQVKK